jgi:hypothetical protein
MVKYADWPHWVQAFVIVPHALLGFVMTWLWWPKTGKGWLRFGILGAYLLVFYLIMHFVFGA